MKMYDIKQQYAMFCCGLKQKTILKGYYNMRNLFVLMLLLANILTIQTAKSAEVLPEQNEMWNAQQAAQNYLLAGDCAKTTIVRNKRFQLTVLNDTVVINGADFTVKCIEKKTQIPVVVVPEKPKNQAALTWTHPNKRENGTELKLSEISGYILNHNGIDIKLGVVNSITITDLPLGLHKFYIKTVDQNGLQSKESAIVEKVI